MKYMEPAKTFLANILSSEGKEKTNVYAYMFLCDFFNFILLIFGFSAFGVRAGSETCCTYFPYIRRIISNDGICRRSRETVV